ncbi:MAG: NAD(P)-dependent oxidoreductase [Alphaproteobacteria bacterium]|nr:NAD(P)-dependent oxidoreductase [Alphaproteobacteria bacterium]
MAGDNFGARTIGWVGAGRMGFPMAQRLLKAGARVSVWNRTRSKAEPLADYGATIVENPAQLADRDIVFTMVAASDDFRDVTIGAHGVLSQKAKPKILIDCTTVSEDASADVRAVATRSGVAMLAAPVSGNGKVVKAGKLSLVVSGPRSAYDATLPYLQALGTGVTYVGEGDVARLMKICHNVFLGVITQSLAEITVLAEKRGVPRHAFLEFMNKSVMGSTFTRYKSPAFVNLDFTVTFTPKLLRKDLDLGLAAARAIDVPMPVAAATREIVQTLIGNGYAETDFAELLTLAATAAGIELKPENVAVDDGLGSKG